MFFFQVVQGNDSMVKNGITTNISVRHQCITVMPNYDKKSIEVVLSGGLPLALSVLYNYY